MENSFSACLLRLKQQLQIHADKDVAALLGQSDKAFSARKKRDAFPETDLRALAQQRPDLKLDVGYVLTGLPTTIGGASAHFKATGDVPAALITTMGKVIDVGSKEKDTAAKERELLSNWRACSSADRQILSALAERLKAARKKAG